MTLRVKRDLLTTEHVALPSGLFVERAVTVEVDDHPDPGFRLEMEIIFDEKVHRLVPKSVRVCSEDGQEVTGTTLRAVRVQDMLQQAGLLILTKRSEGDHGSEIQVREILSSYTSEAGLHKKSPEAAATIYEVASVLNYPPLKTLSDILQVSQSTATRLVAKARKLNLLWTEDG